MEDLDVEEVRVAGAGVPLPGERRELADDLGEVGELRSISAPRSPARRRTTSATTSSGARVADPVAAQLHEALAVRAARGRGGPRPRHARRAPPARRPSPTRERRPTREHVEGYRASGERRAWVRCSTGVIVARSSEAAAIRAAACPSAGHGQDRPVRSLPWPVPDTDLAADVAVFGTQGAPDEGEPAHQVGRRHVGPARSGGPGPAWRASLARAHGDLASAASLTGMSEQPTPQQVRRALARAERGAALDVAEADRPPRRHRRRPRPAHRRRREGPRRRAGRCGPSTAGGRHLLAQGLHPGHQALPRPLPLLHVRGVAGPADPGRARDVPLARRDPRDRPPGRGAGLPRGALHPRRPARGPLARGAGLARRAGLRLDARLRPGDGGAGARGDRPAPPPQPRRHVVGGAQPAQAGLPLDGDDARDHLAAALRDQGRGPLRLPRQGPRGPDAGARGRRPALDPVHHRAAGRHRRDARGAGRDDLRAAPGLAGLRRGPGGHRPELPGQARHRDAARRRPRPRRVPRHHRGHPDRARPQGPGPGAAQPGRPRGVPAAARRRRRRLGRGLPADPRPRQPRAALAVARAAARPHRAVRLRAAAPG